MINKKIMIVDDDKGFLEELRDLLELSGYELIAVNDALAALDVAKSINPSVVILDLKMPKKTGFEIAKELRDIADFANVPIIAMSAFYKDEYKPLLELYGIKRCLKKPFTPLDVIGEIECALLE